MRRQLLAIVAKDTTLILRNRQIWIPMVTLPLVMTIVLPLVFLFGVTAGTQRLQGIQPLLGMIPGGVPLVTDAQKLYYVGLNFMFPPLFLMIPLMAGSIIGASCLVGEKESRTLETLLYTPVSLEQLFVGKLIAAFVPSYVVTLISFAFFVIVVHVAGPPAVEGVGFPLAKWLVLIFSVCPAVILFGLSFMVIISAHATTFQGAQQLSGFVVMPFLLIIIAQSSGAFALQTWHLGVATPVLVLLDYLLIRFAARRLTYERLLD